MLLLETGLVLEARFMGQGTDRVSIMFYAAEITETL